MQTACNLGVRFAWKAMDGHQHPTYTYDCTQDPAMAALAATNAALCAPRGIYLIGLATSASSGRHHPWEKLEWAAAGDRLLVKRGKWIYIPEEPAGWFLITHVMPHLTEERHAVVRVIMNGRGPDYLVDFHPDFPVALRYTHPDE